MIEGTMMNNLPYSTSRVGETNLQTNILVDNIVNYGRSMENGAHNSGVVFGETPKKR